MLKGQEKLKNIFLPLGASECKRKHSALIKKKSQSELDWLHQLHTLDMTEDECYKMLKYCKEIGMSTTTTPKCLAKCDDYSGVVSMITVRIGFFFGELLLCM
jgi:hypothetical protein